MRYFIVLAYDLIGGAVACRIVHRILGLVDEQELASILPMLINLHCLLIDEELSGTPLAKILLPLMEAKVRLPVLACPLFHRKLLWSTALQATVHALLLL